MIFRKTNCCLVPAGWAFALYCLTCNDLRCHAFLGGILIVVLQWVAGLVRMHAVGKRGIRRGFYAFRCIVRRNKADFRERKSALSVFYPHALRLPLSKDVMSVG
ncbi:MAG: hypothetical protein NC344_01855 [Bacteroidales bacterium]|nr:hypothetical protein [Bacteroidales bacterium]MCM1146578.1 hypothetical protein [Bacteroidales bacterium]MCM1205970.1 hypothetical protein [Bacillota bacterium]MCM1510150.1 hypothetical protein [Clostridium sp.]